VIFQRLKKAFSKEKRGGNHTFTDTDRDLSAMTRDIKAQIKRTKQMIQLKELREMLDDMRGDREEEDEDDFNNPVIAMLLQGLLSGQNKGEVNANPFSLQPQQPKEKPSMTDQEIQDFLCTLPKTHLKLIQALPENVLRLKIAEQLPVDDDTITRAIYLIKN